MSNWSGWIRITCGSPVDSRCTSLMLPCPSVETSISCFSLIMAHPWDASARRLFFIHQSYEPVEQIVCVVRAGAGFRVVLDGKNGQLLVPEAFQGLVIEVDVGQFHVLPGQ